MKRTETKENVGSSSKTSRPMPKSKPIGKNVKGSTAGISATHSGWLLVNFHYIVLLFSLIFNLKKSTIQGQ